MIRLWKLVSLAVGLPALGTVLLTAGCGSSKSGSSQTQLRVMNAAVDEPKLDLLVDGTSSATNIAYGTSDGYHSLASGTHHIRIEPSGTNSPFIDQNINFTSGTNTTIIAASPNQLTASSTQSITIVLTDDNSAPAPGYIKLRIVNVAPGFSYHGIGPIADVYIVTPGTDIGGTDPTVSLAFSAASSYQSLSAANHEIIFTPSGQKFIVIDSGSESFSSGQIRTFVALGIGFTLLRDLN